MRPVSKLHPLISIFLSNLNWIAFSKICALISYSKSCHKVHFSLDHPCYMKKREGVNFSLQPVIAIKWLIYLLDQNTNCQLHNFVFNCLLQCVENQEDVSLSNSSAINFTNNIYHFFSITQVIFYTFPKGLMPGISQKYWHFKMDGHIYFALQVILIYITISDIVQ